jgi:hypothetical protein
MPFPSPEANQQVVDQDDNDAEGDPNDDRTNEINHELQVQLTNNGYVRRKDNDEDDDADEENDSSQDETNDGNNLSSLFVHIISIICAQ